MIDLHPDTSVVYQSDKHYPNTSPFHPSEAYPEYPFGQCLSSERNQAYASVRESLRLLGYDTENYGTPRWNPLGHIIQPGMRVSLKPNWVRSRHFAGGDVWSVITHPSVVRAIMDYVWIALKGKGEIIIAEAPQYDCNFSELRQVCQIDALENFYKSVDGPSLKVIDLRRYWSPRRHFPSMKQWLPSDPEGKVTVKMGEDSMVYGKDKNHRFYGAVYHREETRLHHTGDIQEYFISKTILSSDVVINIPKLKVHKKAGVTINMKNFVGASLNTNLNVHYVLGSPKDGGDQYPDNNYTPLEEKIIKIERKMYDLFLAKQSIPLEYIHRSIFWLHGAFLKPFGIKVRKSARVKDAGAWYGNDCAWRFVVDYPRMLTFADTEGRMRTEPQRNVFTIIDGIIGGDNKGPLEPDPQPSGVIITSSNMIAADLVGTRLMDIDYKKLKIFTNILKQDKFNYNIPDVSQIPVHSNDIRTRNAMKNTEEKFFEYKPHPGWAGMLELHKSKQ